MFGLHESELERQLYETGRGGVLPHLPLHEIEKCIVGTECATTACRGIATAEKAPNRSQLGTARILCSWALQGYFAVEHCRDTLRLGTARILRG